MSITQEQKDYLATNMKRLLEEYEYKYSEEAINKIITTWAKNKKNLIESFKKHPHYIENEFCIAFEQDYKRTFDIKAVERFRSYLQDIAPYHKDTLPEEIKKQIEIDGTNYLPRELYYVINYLEDYISQNTLTQVQALRFQEIIPQVHPKIGEKTSRFINRLLNYLKYNLDENYNKEFAKFADAINPLTIKRHTIISVNPLDYLTMSFGNSWSSCHTIDKYNVRHMPNGYQGQYSTGTISYMLDPTSIVLYTVDKEYNGKQFWYEPKITRQMFHYDTNTLIQGRLYPQTNDSGCDDIYEQLRHIMQQTISTINEFTNLWELKIGPSQIRPHVISFGTHYQDYLNFYNCTISTRKNEENTKLIIGHEPICIVCGKEHAEETNINHCATKRCNKCGTQLEEDEVYIVDGEAYCRDCVTYCDRCGSWVLDDDTMYYVDSERRYICEECFNEDYVQCECCNEIIRRDDAYSHDGNYYCESCYEDTFMECESCYKTFYRDEITYYDKYDQYLCEECYRVAMEEENEEN